MPAVYRHVTPPSLCHKGSSQGHGMIILTSFSWPNKRTVVALMLACTWVDGECKHKISQITAAVQRTTETVTAQFACCRSFGRPQQQKVATSFPNKQESSLYPTCLRDLPGGGCIEARIYEHFRTAYLPKSGQTHELASINGAPTHTPLQRPRRLQRRCHDQLNGEWPALF